MSGTHCHFTYEHGKYRSPCFWPTRADAEHASLALMLPVGSPEGITVFQVHTAQCTCAEKEGVAA